MTATTFCLKNKRRPKFNSTSSCKANGWHRRTGRLVLQRSAKTVPLHCQVCRGRSRSKQCFDGGLEDGIQQVTILATSFRLVRNPNVLSPCSKCTLMERCLNLQYYLVLIHTSLHQGPCCNFGIVPCMRPTRTTTQCTCQQDYGEGEVQCQSVKLTCFIFQCRFYYRNSSKLPRTKC